MILRRTLVAAAVVLLTCAAAPAPRQTAYLSCAGERAVRPATHLVACGDGNAGLERLHWVSWDTYSAVGWGTWSQNDCDPYCAAGHFHSYRASRVRLDRAIVIDGRRYFSRTTVHLASRRPPGGRRILVEEWPRAWLTHLVRQPNG